MGSDSRSPRARHRFGFSGPPTRQRKNRVTTDDLLASLTRQAELRQKLGERDRVALEEIAETDDLSRFQGLYPEPESPSIAEKKSRFGHLIFVLMLLSGLMVVWSYSSISKPLDLTSLNGIAQRSAVHSIFGNMVQLGIIALAAVAGALWIRHKRRGTNSQLLPFPKLAT